MNVVAYGGGVNSTAMLIGMHRKGIPIDLVLFADLGAEQPRTYEYLPIMNDWLLYRQKRGPPDLGAGVSLLRNTARHCLRP